MRVQINVFIRKHDHYKLPKSEQYQIKEEFIESSTEQGILDKFYVENKLADMSCYRKFVDPEWQKKLSDWYKTEDYKKRSLGLFYSTGVID